MNLLMINSVNSYIKNIGLQHKWERKKQTNDFSTDEKKNSLQLKNEQFKKSYMEQQENKDETLSNIHNKINAGAKLTPDEMKYLQVKDPTLYQKLKDIENEKKKFERDLKHCKTKDDVEKLKFSKVSAALSSINNVKNNPNIPEGFKLQVASQEMRRLSELDKIAAKFVRSGEYNKLPTDAEKRKAENDIKKAEEAETKKLLHKDTETDNVENTSDNKAETDENGVKADMKPVKTDTTETIDKETVSNEKELSRIEAELSPEAKKVKRSKAKSAYTKSILPEENPTSKIVFRG